ncbi:MAG: hypothetical protein IKR39_07265 [Lachnospiraceae bacterium]|nr:hypothetical protein [Lachnospiraceae bacterium]
MEKEKKRRIGIVTILGVIILAMVAFIIYRLVDWDARSITVVTDDIEEGEFDIEVQDMYFYPPEGDFPNHVKDDVEDIVVIGNVYANNSGNEHSILNMLRDNLDANIIDITVDKSRVSCDGPEIVCGVDCASLYHLVSEIADHDIHALAETEWATLFFDEDRYYKFLKTANDLDFNKVDTVIIMYNLIDYYAGKAALAISEDDIRGLRGSYEQSLTLLQEKYPHLNIILVSPYPSVFTDENGNLVYSNMTDYGLLTSSYYFENIYFVATKYATSFVDNYTYGISESNITEYVKDTQLTDKGIDFLGQHIIDFLEKKGGVNY